MTNRELYELLNLPKDLVFQLNEYEKTRRGEVPILLKDKLFSRATWEEGVKELQEYLGEDYYHINILYEQLNFVAQYSADMYERRGIPEQIFVDTFGFITRFVVPTKDEKGKYYYNWAWWFQRQVTLQEFRIGSLEYEFVESDGHREIEIHIPSDADMTMEGLRKSISDFEKFESKYMNDWCGVPISTNTWMIMPELEEFLPEDSKILGFKSMFSIESVDYDQTWYMGWIFPGFSVIDENLPEKTMLQRKLKAYLLSGKKFGVAKGYLI